MSYFALGAGSIAAFRRLAPNMQASILMILSFVIFMMMAVLMRIVGDTVPVVEVVLVRQLVAFILLAPLFWRARASIRRPTGLPLHLARGVLAVGAMGCGLTATLLIPLADSTAIQMAEVLIATALAAILLHEKVGWRRWSATVIGFVGVIIMMKPFGNGVETASLIALFGAMCGAGNMIAVRMGASHDRTVTVLFWQGIVVLALVAPVAVWFWVTPTWFDAWVLLAMGGLFTLGLLLFTFAMRIGDTSAIAPIHYVRLLMMAALGWLVYGEIPSLETVIGGSLVLGAATYTLSRNAKRKSSVDPSAATLP